MRLFKLVLALLVLLLLILFVRQNWEVLTQKAAFRLDLYVKSFESPPHEFWKLILFSLFLGSLGTALYSLQRLWRERSLNRQLRQDLELLRREVEVVKGGDGS